MDIKHCIGCNQDLPIANFIPPRGAGIPYAKCCSCTRHEQQQRKLLERSLNPADYPIPSCCELCNKEFGVKKNDSPHFDHDHVTNKFRGWLCGRCNLALGFMKDSVETAERIVLYLKKGK